MNQIEGAPTEKEDQRKSINDLIDKHKELEEKLRGHVEKQHTDQEDQFKRKMRERKDRSISRSLNKSADVPRTSKFGMPEEPFDDKNLLKKDYKIYESNSKFGAEAIIKPKAPPHNPFKSD